MNTSGSAMEGFSPPRASKMIAFRCLLPITAPNPPRAAIREGTPSLSRFWMPAAARPISPGPIRAMAVTPIALSELLGCQIYPHSHQIPGRLEPGSGRAQAQNPPTFVRRLVFKIKTFIPSIASAIPVEPPALACLIPRRQGALGANRDPVQTGKHVTHQQAGGKDELIELPKRVASRVDLVDQDTRDQPAPPGLSPRFRVPGLFHRFENGH